MSRNEEFVRLAKQGKVLLVRCVKCGLEHSSVTYFCGSCGSSEFSDHPVDGVGRVVTYTIITVPPAGFEEYTPYAFVVVSLDGTDLRVSGFMGGIAAPADLPVGTRVRVTGYDGRGLLVEKS